MAVLRLITSSYFGGILHRHVGWLLAPEDAIDVAGRAPELVNRISPVGDKTTLDNEVAERVDRGQLLPSRQGDDQVTVNRRRRTAGDDQPAIRAARHCRKAAFDFAGIAHIDWAQLHPKRRSCGLDCGPLADPSRDP